MCARTAPEDFLCIFILSRYQECATKCARIAWWFYCLFMCTKVCVNLDCVQLKGESTWEGAIFSHKGRSLGLFRPVFYFNYTCMYTIREYSDYILSNKSNAPNIKLNHRFIFTLTDYMSVYVRYEYDKCLNQRQKIVITEPWLDLSGIVICVQLKRTGIKWL